VVVSSCAKASTQKGTEFVRVGTIRRSTTAGRRNVSALPANKRKSPTLQAKVSIDLLMEKIKRCEVHFVQSLSPTMQSEQSALTEMPFLRMQIRGLRLVEAGRLIKQGYPDSLGFDEFIRKYNCLIKVKFLYFFRNLKKLF
jgi:myosin-18